MVIKFRNIIIPIIVVSLLSCNTGNIHPQRNGSKYYIGHKQKKDKKQKQIKIEKIQ